MSAHLHVPVAFLPVLIEAGWVTEVVRTALEQKQALSHAGTRTPGRTARS
jgi:hypothetical protein